MAIESLSSSSTSPDDYIPFEILAGLDHYPLSPIFQTPFHRVENTNHKPSNRTATKNPAKVTK